jgi:hypothetical protein
MRRDLFMGKLNPEKFSQKLQDLNRYLDFIPIEKTSDSLKITKAYGKSLPEDEIRSIMGRAIPLNGQSICWHLGKNLGGSKILRISSMCIASSGSQINKRKSLLKWLEIIHTSQTTINRKIVIEIITIPTAGAVVLATAITIAEDAADVEEAAVVAASEPTIVSIYRMLNALIVARKVTTPLIVPNRETITLKTQTWFPKRISKTCFNPP